jgi:hypothetical protein
MLKLLQTWRKLIYKAGIKLEVVSTLAWKNGSSKWLCDLPTVCSSVFIADIANALQKIN